MGEEAGAGHAEIVVVLLAIDGAHKAGEKNGVEPCKDARDLTPLGLSRLSPEETRTFPVGKWRFPRRKVEVSPEESGGFPGGKSRGAVYGILWPISLHKAKKKP